MAEEQEIKTNRVQIIEILKNLHPESDLNDEETLFGIIIDDYESYANLIESREDDLSKAEAIGEIKGRNAKIEELMLHQEDKGDGVPALAGANTKVPTNKQSIFHLAHGAR